MIPMREPVTHPFDGDYREFVDLCKVVVRGLWREFSSPDGDAPPLLLMHRAGQLEIHQIGGQWFESAARKKALIETVVVPMIRAGHAVKIAISSAAWTCDSDSPAGVEVERLRQAGEPIPWLDELGLPGVREEVFVSAFDAERHEFWVARVNRSPTMAPWLARWVMPGGPDMMTGIFADPIKAAMR